MRKALFSGVAVAVLAVSACGGADESTSDSGTQQLTWAMQPSNPTNISFDLALQNGMGADHNLEIEEVTVTGGAANQIAAVQNGSADFFFATLDGLAAARAQGQSISFFCGQIRTFALPLMATPEMNLRTLEEMDGDWNATVQQFRGAKLGVPARGSSFELRTVEILNSGGLSAEDVTFVPVGIGQPVRAALESDQIDGLLSYPPDYMVLEDEGLATTVVDANVDGPEEFRDLFGVGFASTDNWIAENPDAVSALCETQKQVTEAIDSGDLDDAMREILPAEYGIPIGILDEVIASLKDDYYTPEIDEESVTKSIEMMEQGGALEPGAVTADDLIAASE